MSRSRRASRTTVCYYFYFFSLPGRIRTIRCRVCFLFDSFSLFPRNVRLLIFVRVSSAKTVYIHITHYTAKLRPAVINQTETTEARKRGGHVQMQCRRRRHAHSNASRWTTAIVLLLPRPVFVVVVVAVIIIVIGFFFFIIIIFSFCTRVLSRAAADYRQPDPSDPNQRNINDYRWRPRSIPSTPFGSIYPFRNFSGSLRTKESGCAPPNTYFSL